MTRREEIINNIGYKMTRAALEYVEKHEFADAMDAFEAGAEWMQERMIEKAVEWIRTNWREYINGPDKDGCIAFAHWENDFRRAMEE